MRLIDTRWIGDHGIGRFAREVSRRLNMHAFYNSRSPLSVSDPALTSARLLRTRPEHYFSPGFNSLIGRPCSFSLTIHDLIHVEIPQETSPIKKLYYNHVLRPNLKNAEIVFTVSQFSKSKIIDWANLSEDKVIVVGNGVDESFSPLGESYSHKKPYILYVGNHKPHKNIPQLLKAYSKSVINKECDLLMSGSLSGSLMEVVKEYDIQDKVKPLGFIEEAELPSLYRGAHALIMPSLYEGFGLPVIEAMACGTTVVSSSKSSLPEVGGSAAIYFDPDHLDGFIFALDKLEDSSLVEGKKDDCLSQSSKYSWSKVSEKILFSINSLAE